MGFATPGKTEKTQITGFLSKMHLKPHHRLAIALIAVLFFGELESHAEYDSGKFFPSITDIRLTNVFFESQTGVAFPLTFTSQDLLPMTSYGGDFSFGFGYNWGGWLIGLEYNRSMYGEGKASGALMENVVNNLFALKLQRLITNTSWSWLPPWIEIVPGLTFGVDMITTDYYASTRAKDEGRLTSVTFGQEGARCFFGKLTYENSFYFGTDLFIPYIEGDYNVSYDTSIGGGFAMFFTANVGFRTYPLGLFHKNKIREARKAKEKAAREKALEAEKARQEPEEPKEASVTLIDDTDRTPAEASIQSDIHRSFTPDSDGVNDTAKLTLGISNITDKPLGWKLEILDQKGGIFRSTEGEGMFPEYYVWDGKGNDNEEVFSLNTYTARFTVLLSEKDVERTGQKTAVAKDEITTGVQMIVIIPEKKWKIIVNTIHFDPDKATFVRISEAQQKENIETLDSIAEQIEAHPNCLITIEGYANNVTNTEREDKEELIPLSQERAEAILELLAERGMKKEIMSAKGKGGASPLAAWEDRASWWKNRRVEFIVDKIEEGE